MRKSIASLALLLMLVAPAQAERDGTLRLALQDDLRSLDPAVGYDIPVIGAERLLYNGLLTYDRTGKLVGDLASSWQVLDGGKRYRFTLRKGVLFSDGRPMTSRDVRYSLERLLWPETKSQGTSFYEGIQGASSVLAGKTRTLRGVATPSPDVVEIRLESTNPAFLSLLALPFTSVIPAGSGESFGHHPIGTGPFKLFSWTPGQKIVWVRNPHYFKPGLPRLERVEYLLGINEQVECMKFERGELDLLGINRHIPAAEYVRFRSEKRWQPYFLSGPDTSVHYLGMNTELKPFSDPRVRRAVAMAIFKKKIVRLNNGRGEIATGILPPTIRQGPPPAGIPFDPKGARALLQQAGYPHGFKTTYWCSNNPVTLKIAQSIQQDLRGIGIELELKPMTFSTLLTGVGRRRNAPIFAGNWTADFPDPSNFLVSLFHSRGIQETNALNTTFYSNRLVDRWLNRAEETADPAARWKLYKQAEQRVLSDLPMVPLYHPLNVDLRQPWVQGYFIHPIWPIDWEGIWIR